MLIRMLETRRGSPDGFKVIRYNMGEYYDVPDTLAKSFIGDDWAMDATLSAPEIRQPAPNKAMSGYRVGCVQSHAED